MVKKSIKFLNRYVVLTYFLFGFLFWHLAKDMLQVRSDGWYVGQVNLYGDLVFHLGFINKFLATNSVLVGNPIYASEKPDYPIFADFVTAQIARIAGVDFALFITTFTVGILTIYLMRNFILNFIKSDKIIFLALLIFFLNGGFGFYYFFQDLANSHRPFLDFITSLPHEYTDIKEKGYWWINVYLAYFLPQRTFLFAFPITIAILNLLYLGYRRSKTLLFVIAGLLCGTLPLVQAHSLFFIFAISLYFSIVTIFSSKFNKTVILNWLVFGVITALLAIPLFHAISSLSNPLKFVKIEPGWTSQENLIWFWLKNLGIFAPVLIAALIWLFGKKHLFYLYIPFFLIFIISNIFVFQPWNFDNSKLLIYWYFASAVIVAYFLYDKLLSEPGTKRIFGIVIIFIMILSGSLDLFRTFTKVTSYQIFTNQDLAIAESVKLLTPKNSIFVTASSHNHPIPALTGRSTLVGFHGWLWSHGIPYEERANDVGRIYLGGKSAEDLIKKYKVNYVTIGPHERQEFKINESYFNQFPQTSIAGDWRLYDVSNLWSNSNR